MAVAFDAGAGPGAIAAYHAVSVTAITTNTGITVGAGANRILTCPVAFANNALPSNLVAHWDSTGTNQAMTLIGSVLLIPNQAGNSTVAGIFALLAPTSGQKTINVTWTGSLEALIAPISFTGADQGSVTTTCKFFSNTDTSSGGSTNVNVAVTGGATDGMVGIFIDNNNSENITAISDTAYDGGAIFETFSAYNGGWQYAVGKGNHSLTWTSNLAIDWLAGAVNIAAVGSLATGKPIPAFNKSGGIIRRTNMVGFRAPRGIVRRPPLIRPGLGAAQWAGLS
jgi:hypothetical protein